MTRVGYKQVLITCPDYKSENINASLFVMIDLFSGYAAHIANELDFHYNHEEQENTTSYLRQLLTRK